MDWLFSTSGLLAWSLVVVVAMSTGLYQWTIWQLNWRFVLGSAADLGRDISSGSSSGGSAVEGQYGAEPGVCTQPSSQISSDTGGRSFAEHG